VHGLRGAPTSSATGSDIDRGNQCGADSDGDASDSDGEMLCRESLSAASGDDTPSLPPPPPCSDGGSSGDSCGDPLDEEPHRERAAPLSLSATDSRALDEDSRGLVTGEAGESAGAAEDEDNNDAAEEEEEEEGEREFTETGSRVRNWYGRRGSATAAVATAPPPAAEPPAKADRKEALPTGLEGGAYPSQSGGGDEDDERGEASPTPALAVWSRERRWGGRGMETLRPLPPPALRSSRLLGEEEAEAAAARAMRGMAFAVLPPLGSDPSRSPTSARRSIAGATATLSNA